MKKRVYNYQSFGNNSIELEIFLNANRELTEIDEKNIRIAADGIISSIMDENLNLDPKVREKARQEREDILAIFSGREIFVEETNNEYLIQPYSKYYPWLIVTTSKGRIKIGWRKRVINIDWSESIIEGIAKDLFPDEDVTKFDKIIHAWGYEKAKEYIDLLLK
jgi:hypothetical protein